MALRDAHHACILSPDRALRERPVHHEPAGARAPVSHADGNLERAARIVEGGACLRQFTDGVRRIGVGKLDSLERFERRAGRIECRLPPDRHVAAAHDPGGKNAVIAFAHGRRERGHHDRRRPGVADHLGVLHAIEKGHRIGPAGRLTHRAGLDDVTFEQLCEVDLGFFSPAGTGRWNGGGGRYSCGSERPAKCGEVANHPGWGTAARP